MSSVNKQLIWKATVSNNANTWLQISTDKQQWYTTIDPVVGNAEVYTKVIPGDGSGTITFTCKNCEKEISKTVFVQRCPCELDSIAVEWNNPTNVLLSPCGKENFRIDLTGKKISSFTNCEQVVDDNYTSTTYISYPNNDTDSSQYLFFEHEFARFIVTQDAGPCSNGCTCSKAGHFNVDNITFEPGENNKREFFTIDNIDCIGGVIPEIENNTDNWFSIINENNTYYIKPKDKNNTNEKKTCTIKVTYDIQSDTDENTDCGTKTIDVTHNCVKQYNINPSIASGTLSCNSESRTVTFTAEVKNNN